MGGTLVNPQNVLVSCLSMRGRGTTLVMLLLGHYEKNIRNLQIGTNYAEVV